MAELRDLGRMGQQMRPPCTCRASFPGDGTTTYRSRRAVVQLNQAECTQSPVDPTAVRALIKSPGLQVSWCWVPSGSLLPRNPPTYIRQYPQHCRVGRGWIFLGLKGKGEATMRRQPLAVSSGTFHCNI